MINTNEFNFNYSISVNPYNRNKDAVSNILWNETTGTIQDLSDKIKNGYAFCNCFNTDGNKTFSCAYKTDNNLSAAYLICFDFDAVKYSVSAFNNLMAQTEIKPNITYTTQNNGHYKPNKNEDYNNRYRAIYIIDTPILNKELYTEIHQQLKKEISLLLDDSNIFNDNTDKSVSHFFAGCKDTTITTDNNVYSLQWLIERYGITTPNKKDTQSNNKGINTHNNNVSVKKDTQSNNKDYIRTLLDNKLNAISKKDTQNNNIKKENSIITLCGQFESDYYNLPISQIIKKYISIYRPIDATPLEDNGELIINLPSEYTEIRRRYKVIERVKTNGDTYKTTASVKRKDGEGRRRNIYLNLLLRKRISPNISMEEMLFCGLWELYYYINNTAQDKITKNDIAKIAVNAYFDDVNIKDTNKKKYKINKQYCIDNFINPKSANLMYLNNKKREEKKQRDERIKELYNAKLTDNENITLLSKNDITISVKTLRRWKKENGITKKYKKRANKSVLSDSNDLMDNNSIQTDKTQQRANKEQISVNNPIKNKEIITEQNNMKIKTDNKVNNSLELLNNKVRELKTEKEIKEFDFNVYYPIMKENNIITAMIKAKGDTDVKKGLYLKENNYIAFILYLQSKIKNNMSCKTELLKMVG